MDSISAYINRLALAGFRPRTLDSRERCLRAFADMIDPHTVETATRSDVEAYLGRPLAPESRRAYRAHLRSFYAYLLDEQVITEDPTIKIPPVRVPRGAPRPLPPSQFALVVDRATPRMRAWVLLMALAGLRRSEVALLRPCDLLPTEAGTLLFLRETKGGGSAMVPAHPAVLEALAALPVRNGLWWACTPNTLGSQVSCYLKSLGINASGHALRHTAGTAWYRASGHDLLTTATLLRHASIQTTQIYAQLDPTRPAEVVALVALPTI